jgi:hypothetical protein
MHQLGTGVDIWAWGQMSGKVWVRGEAALTTDRYTGLVGAALPAAGAAALADAVATGVPAPAVPPASALGVATGIRNASKSSVDIVATEVGIPGLFPIVPLLVCVSM